MRLAACILVLIAIAATPASAAADFGFRPGYEGFDASIEKSGLPVTNSGTHPDAVQVHLGFKLDGEVPGQPGNHLADGDLRNLRLTMPAGFLTAPTAPNQCTQADFHTPRSSPYQSSLSGEDCPNSSQVGVIAVTSSTEGGSTRYFGVFNLVPPAGSPAAIGFAPFGTPIEMPADLREADVALQYGFQNLPQRFDVQSLDLTLWGTPWLSSHDAQRGDCLDEKTGGSFGECFVFVNTSAPAALIKSYLTLPTSPCAVPLHWEAAATSWQGAGDEAAVDDHDSEGHALRLHNCLPSRSIGSAKLRTGSAASATGFVFGLETNDGGGLFNEEGHVTSPTEKAVVALPEGLTINPSLGAGLGVCTEADFARETISTPPGSGCPNASKIGDVSVEGLMGSDEPVGGSVYLAQPYANPFGALIGLYVTVSSPQRGLFGKAFGEVVPDPRSGRLVASFENLPKLHYTHFSLDLREGQRAAMVSPPTCGGYGADLELTPWSSPSERIHDTSTFFITSGENGGPCPGGGLAPFQPGLEAGSLNPQAGAYSSFFLRMTRSDADQEITSYSATFPPGMLGKIAGIPYCPDAAIEAAKARTGVEERDHPSCPADSTIGRTVSGYGLGGTLAYAPGGLYLAGPYHGAPLSIVAIDSALVGPFDLGVVVVRSAIRVDPLSAQATVDSAGSDPIPHILKGIPIHLRDIRVYLDRPSFMVNPTSCDVMKTTSLLTGAGADVFSSADDVPASSAQRYQLANCSALGFKPEFSLALKGGTERGRYPALRAVYQPRVGDGNIAKAVVTLPHSLFLATEHLETVCTRPELAAHKCPPGSQLGTAEAITPLLEVPLSGGVYLRSSDHALPDIVADLQGRGIEILLEGRVSGKHGGLRASFEALPDAPVTRFTMNLFSGRHGLLQVSENLCAAPQRASAYFVAHDSSSVVERPQLKVRCKKKSRRKRR
jgi:hypothetical protein